MVNTKVGFLNPLLTAEFRERVERIAREKQKGTERIWESWRV